MTFCQSLYFLSHFAIHMLIHTPSKRPRISDSLTGEFFSKVAPLIKDVQVKNWDHHNEDVSNEAIVRALVELIFHSLKERTIITRYREKLSVAEKCKKKYDQEVSNLKN